MNLHIEADPRWRHEVSEDEFCRVLSLGNYRSTHFYDASEYQDEQGRVIGYVTREPRRYYIENNCVTQER